MSENPWEMTEYQYCMYRQRLAEHALKEANGELEHWKRKVRAAWAKERADNKTLCQAEGTNQT